MIIEIRMRQKQKKRITMQKKTRKTINVSFLFDMIRYFLGINVLRKKTARYSMYFNRNTKLHQQNKKGMKECSL